MYSGGNSTPHYTSLSFFSPTSQRNPTPLLLGRMPMNENSFLQLSHRIQIGSTAANSTS